MNKRENYLSIINRTGYEQVPVEFFMCESLAQSYNSYIEEHIPDFDILPAYDRIDNLIPEVIPPSVYDFYYQDYDFKPGTYYDLNGVAHEPGSAAAFHMTKMYHPLDKAKTVADILDYPFLNYRNSDTTKQFEQVKATHKKGLAARGDMPMTIWESAWYMRGMENLMSDMLLNAPMAEAMLDKVTEIAIFKAENYAKAGIDVLYLGDDIGMQSSIMMSTKMYRRWLKPRIQMVIAAAKKIKPDLKVQYHSCGYVEPFIPDLIEVGVDILNPVQPECMDFQKLHAQYGDVLSFNGTIGTQTTMPFGTPDDVRRVVFKNLEIAGAKGGLLVCPAHMLEPEVPLANILAYLQACHDFTR